MEQFVKSVLIIDPELEDKYALMNRLIGVYNEKNTANRVEIVTDLD